jgi:hypothetical protein
MLLLQAIESTNPFNFADCTGAGICFEACFCAKASICFGA